MRPLLRAFGAWGLALFGLGACAPPPLDTTRVPLERGTLGEEVYRLFARDYAREDARRAEGFALAEDDLVGAIDHMFPPEELRETQDFFVGLLPLHDDGTIAVATRSLAEAAQRLSEDEEALRSLAALGYRAGYVDLSHEYALMRRIAAYPKFRDLMKAVLRLAREHDGRDDLTGDPDPNEANELAVLQDVLSERLRTAELSQDDQRDIVLLVDLLLSEDARLAEGQADEAIIVARDPRGMARVGEVAGSLSPPFVDVAPADGLADVDAAGRFVDAAGAPIDQAPFGGPGPRDPVGRAVLSPGGPTVFEYVDLDRTLLAGFLRDTRTLVDRGVPMKAVRTLDTVLGDRTSDGRYGTVNSPLLDVAYASAVSGDLRDLPELLQLVRILLERHEATTAWTLLEVQAQLDIADRHPVALRAGNTFFDELMSVVRRILLEPGLAEALLEVLRAPAVAGLPDATARLLAHEKARIVPEDVRMGTVFDTPVDRSLPDVRNNQSIGQRLFHLIHDTRGAKYTPRLIGIPLGFIFEIDDLAEFYLLSIIGEAEVPALVSTLTGLSQRPTSAELAVFINADQTFGNPKGHDGIDVKDNDGDTLFAVDESGMTDALRPLVRLFHDRGQLRLLFDLFDVLHMHWATEQSDYQNTSASQPRFSRLSGIRRFEPMLIEIFTQTKVLQSAQKLLTETLPVATSRGRPAHAIVLSTARHIFGKDQDLRTRSGAREVLIDGQRVTPLSPFDLFRDALTRLDRIIVRNATTEREWTDVVDAVHEILLEVERTGPEAGQLVSGRALPVVTRLLDFLEARALRHANDRSTWLRVDVMGGMEDAVSSAELPAIFDLLYAIDADDTISSATNDLRDELLDESRGFHDLLVTLGDGLSAAKDASIAVPALRWLGRELDSNHRHLFRVLHLTEASLDGDPDQHLLEVTRRGLEPSAQREPYSYGIATAVRQAHRANPVSLAPPNAEDLRRMLAATAEWLVDGEHGLEKFYSFVAHRKLAE